MQPARSGLCGPVWLRRSHTHAHTLSVPATQIHIHKDHIKDISFSARSLTKKPGRGALWKTIKIWMWHATLQIQTGRMAQMQSHTRCCLYKTLDKVNWAGQLVLSCLFPSQILSSFCVYCSFVSTFMTVSSHMWLPLPVLSIVFLLHRCVFARWNWLTDQLWIFGEKLFEFPPCKILPAALLSCMR